jgi:hypothetical protein
LSTDEEDFSGNGFGERGVSDLHRLAKADFGDVFEASVDADLHHVRLIHGNDGAAVGVRHDTHAAAKCGTWKRD